VTERRRPIDRRGRDFEREETKAEAAAPSSSGAANASLFDVPPAERSQSQSIVTNAEKFEPNAAAV
jgi:hypothetical protein